MNDQQADSSIADLIVKAGASCDGLCSSRHDQQYDDEIDSYHVLCDDRRVPIQDRRFFIVLQLHRLGRKVVMGDAEHVVDVVRRFTNGYFVSGLLGAALEDAPSLSWAIAGELR